MQMAYEMWPGQMAYQIETLLDSFELSTSFPALAETLLISEDALNCCPYGSAPKLSRYKSPETVC